MERYMHMKRNENLKWLGHFLHGKMPSEGQVWNGLLDEYSL